MTRKDYERFAAEIRRWEPNADPLLTREDLAYWLSRVFVDDNVRFSRERFVAASVRNTEQE